MTHRIAFWLLASGAWMLAAPRSVAAQIYPERPIRIIVSSAAGGPLDIVGRAVADKLAASLREPVVVETRARKAISPEQYAAAQKYRHHWYFGGLHDHLGSLDLTRILAGHHGDYSSMARSENQAFHRQRFREAVQAIGKIGSHVLDSAVCREMPLEQVGYALGWGNRAQAYAAAAERMKIALDGLCKLWGIG
jgi:hypothetical protein